MNQMEDYMDNIFLEVEVLHLVLEAGLKFISILNVCPMGNFQWSLEFFLCCYRVTFAQMSLHCLDLAECIRTRAKIYSRL